jgi:hypothetical protein
LVHDILLYYSNYLPFTTPINVTIRDSYGFGSVEYNQFGYRGPTPRTLETDPRWKNFSSQASRKLTHWRKLMIENWLITREEFMQKISEERATYQKLLIPRRNDHW